MKIKNKEPKIFSIPYDRKQILWAVMYGKQVVRIYPRGRDAQKDVVYSNNQWEKNNWGKPWSVKRFKAFFKGEEIEYYEHIIKKIKHENKNKSKTRRA